MKTTSFYKIKILSSRNFILSAVLIILLSLFSILDNTFFTISNILLILKNNSSLGILAIGITLTMISGEVDISIGANMGLTSVIIGVLFTRGVNIWTCVLVGVITGILIGLLNSFLVLVLNINSLIATLGTLAIIQGLAFTIANGLSFSIIEKVLGYIGRGIFFRVPFPVILLIIISIIIILSLKYTKYGRYSIIIGFNSKVALLSGIRIKRIKFINLMFCAFLASIAGLIVTGNTGVAMPQHGGQGMELTVLSAAILGGASLSGGGSIQGTILGVLILGVIYSGLTQFGIPVLLIQIIRGFLLILIVGLYEGKKNLNFGKG